MIQVSGRAEHVWIGVGSNLLNPKYQVDSAIWAISRLPMTNLVAVSKYYRSLPLLERQCQPDFLNAVIVLETDLSPEILLDYLQYIEKRQGRIRNSMIWQSRTLDLDILLFGKNIINTSKLIVPHYGIFDREFVIYPLIELDRNLIFPNGTSVLDLIKIIPQNGLSIWNN